MHVEYESEQPTRAQRLASVRMEKILIFGDK